MKQTPSAIRRLTLFSFSLGLAAALPAQNLKLLRFPDANSVVKVGARFANWTLAAHFLFGDPDHILCTISRL